MANPILIGVGGTGQTVLCAYLRLAELAGFTPAPFYVLDSDTKGPLTGMLTKLRGRIKETIGGNMASRWTIDPFPAAQVERKTFGALFGNLTGDRRELFNCLFSEEGEQTKIRTGMYGRPSIGATSIRYKILRDDADLREMKDTLRGGDKHIILIGSCFGGTGSGGVPMLAAEFDRLEKEEQGYSLRVDALTFLPWFRLVLPEGVTKSKDQDLHEHLSEHFEPNAAAGIFYFKDKIKDYIDSLILIGVKDPGMIRRTSDESNQGEAAHILNLFAAALIQNHITGKLKPPDGISGYWYDEEVGLSPRFLTISRNENSSEISLLNVIKRTYIRKQWLIILKTFFDNYDKIDRVHRPPFIDLILDRLQGAAKTRTEVLGEISNRLNILQGIVDDGYDWLLKMEDPIFCRIESEDRIVQAIEYTSMRYDPLPVISEWCNHIELIAGRFTEQYMRTSEAFCDRFTDLFLEDLTKRFNL